MSPDSILKDRINRASKAKHEQNKSENQIVAKELEQQMTLIINHLVLLLKLN